MDGLFPGKPIYKWMMTYFMKPSYTEGAQYGGVNLRKSCCNYALLYHYYQFSLIVDTNFVKYDIIVSMSRLIWFNRDNNGIRAGYECGQERFLLQRICWNYNDLTTTNQCDISGNYWRYSIRG